MNIEYNNKNKRLNIDKLSKSELTKLKNSVTRSKIIFITGTCKKCKIKFESQINQHSDISKINLCKSCKIKATNLERYGVENVSQLPENVEKARKTLKKRYGGYTFESKELSKKAKRTCKELYGVENVFELNEFQEKAKQTIINKYGVDNIFKDQDTKERIRGIQMEKYGGTGFSSKIIKQRIENTCENRYNNKNYRNPTKMIETRLNTYGTTTFFVKYRYDNLQFDSSWELAFYIYHKDKGHKIEREPKSFEYIRSEDKSSHLYTPDFKVGNKCYEIKGEQFIKRYKNGKIKTFKSPYKDRPNSIYEDIFKCIKKNKIIILTYIELQKVFEYVDNTYGHNYMKQFKI